MKQHVENTMYLVGLYTEKCNITVQKMDWVILNLVRTPEQEEALKTHILNIEKRFFVKWLLIFRGWMQEEIFAPIRSENFLYHARPTADDPVLLILDGHATYTKNLTLLEMARANNMHNRIQALDVGFMKSLSTFDSKIVKTWIRNNPGKVVDMKDISPVFGAEESAPSIPTYFLRKSVKQRKQQTIRRKLKMGTMKDQVALQNLGLCQEILLSLHHPHHKAYQMFDEEEFHEVLAEDPSSGFMTVQCLPIQLSAQVASPLWHQDDIYQVTMYEAARLSVLGCLRVLFTHIIFHCNVADPLMMYKNFKPYLLYDMCDDLEASKNRGLMHFQLLLGVFNKTLAEYGLPCPDVVIFVDGPGGSEKTFLYSYIIHSLHVDNKIICPVAWTSIASILLAEGSTSHALFKLPVAVKQGSVFDISTQSSDAELLHNCRLMICDEAPMAPKEALHCVHRLVQNVTKNDHTKFGGKVLLLGGDFRQVLPVVSYGGSVDQQFLLHISEGKCPPISGLPEDYVKLTDFFVLPENSDVCSHVFRNEVLIEEAVGDRVVLFRLHLISIWAILYPCSEDVDDINTIMVVQLGGGNRMFLSHGQLEDTRKNSMNVSVEFLNSLTVSSLLPHSLALAVSMCIMLVRHIDNKHGLSNSTRLVVINMSDYVNDAKIITGPYKGKRAYILRIH
ncbi:hypothetical protein PR048_012027 [Dryococelus australis]|uniref:ATP-dependent DNA helicase n=1 Tax=Dryococelus australis TaxID=614101 RepID=A0ABQ9HNA9_9NEOP|nr:hypothetical protein PR048_012027 [Dryococelus australis]